MVQHRRPFSNNAMMLFGMSSLCWPQSETTLARDWWRGDVDTTWRLDVTCQPGAGRRTGDTEAPRPRAVMYHTQRNYSKVKWSKVRLYYSAL